MIMSQQKYVMNDPITQPDLYPRQAALQLVIELVRAGKLSPLQGNAENMIDIYQQFKKYFEQDQPE